MTPITAATTITQTSAELAGKRALVTGGTRGIGKGITDRLWAAGATVVVAARTTPDAPTEGFVKADVSTVSGTTALAERTLELLGGGLDILIHNVGGSDIKPGGTFSLTDDDWQQGFEMNFFGAVRLDRALTPTMIENNSGVIVHITSVQRRSPMPGTAPYAAAKAALANYSKSLSNDLARHGIRVNSVSPGFIETEAAKEFTNQHAAVRQISSGAAREEIIESIGGIPLGQPGTPHDVGDLVAFLVSDRARYLTGAEYVIDGGSTRTI
jgi:NAD(P)-dependent dehydrogenase (short-subunit alcohol dehydrogenase family)